MNACSVRCGFCGRCSTGTGRRRAELTRDDLQFIHDGFERAGLDRDYFDFYDIDYLAKQGKTPHDIVADAIEHHDRYVRMARGISA